ncbi:Glycosyltransferase [Heracleum sosnowskyi]|uniref:Glycosyltransferase n=1 Tax=Heracleum sosnowskyi TaxID=360622 RepID=A0AAD8MBM3_9APIA|nr:Glycosyltransferase [Heracleum sosnowskyi]
MAANKSNVVQTNKIPVVLVMVPFPAQGHINQLLQLSTTISATSDIPVHFVTTDTLLHQAKSRFAGAPLTNINFHEFTVPSFLAAPSQNSGKLSGLFQPSAEAAMHLRHPVAELLALLSVTTHRLVLIYDFLSSVTVQDFISLPNVEGYSFQGVSAFMAFTFFWELYGKPNIINDATVEYLPPIDSSFPPEFVEHITRNLKLLNLITGFLYDGCRLLEGKYIDLINSKEMMGPDVKQWALGPFDLLEVTPKKEPSERHKSLKWLDEQSEKSVIYVCFGTSVSISDEQVEELAIGLEKSGKKFIWVLRVADKEALPREEGAKGAKLPDGYEERVKEQGIIIRDWAPQIEILAHSSTGGFLTHCGWNSCMESLTMGVPIAAWPMHCDQPRNSLLITKGLKTGEQIRKRAEEVSVDLWGSVAKGGITRAELESFLLHITRELI